MYDSRPAIRRGGPPRPRSTLLFVAALTACVACSARTTPPRAPAELVEAERQRQYEEAATRLLEHMVRVSRVGARVTIAGAPFCGDDVKPFVGILSASRGSVARQLGRHDAWMDAGRALRDAWEIDGTPEVLAVLPDSPAERAGVLPGDHVVDVGAIDDRADSPVWMKVKRRGRTIQTQLAYVEECAYGVSATIGDLVNAHVDGRTVMITTGLLRFVESDDELAVVIGHELAHRILGHRRSRRRSRENAADYLGLYLAARAGYDPAAAATFVRRLAAEHPELISDRASPGHPSTAHRVAALTLTVAEIEDKHRRGQGLWPGPLDGL